MKRKLTKENIEDYIKELNASIMKIVKEQRSTTRTNIFGSKYYYKFGQLHRTKGPAVIMTSGIKEWWQNGKRHRIDGPAVINKSLRYEEYWVDDVKCDKKDFENFAKNYLRYSKLKELE